MISNFGRDIAVFPQENIKSMIKSCGSQAPTLIVQNLPILAWHTGKAK